MDNYQQTIRDLRNILDNTEDDESLRTNTIFFDKLNTLAQTRDRLDLDSSRERNVGIESIKHMLLSKTMIFGYLSLIMIWATREFST